MFKNILFGLGSVGMVGGGGYMIYNATRSGGENKTEAESQKAVEKETEKVSERGDDNRIEGNNLEKSLNAPVQTFTSEGNGTTS